MFGDLDIDAGVWRRTNRELPSVPIWELQVNSAHLHTLGLDAVTHGPAWTSQQRRATNVAATCQQRAARGSNRGWTMRSSPAWRQCSVVRWRFACQTRSVWTLRRTEISASLRSTIHLRACPGAVPATANGGLQYGCHCTVGVGHSVISVPLGRDTTGGRLQVTRVGRFPCGHVMWPDRS